MQLPTRTKALVAVAAVAVLGLAACGDDDEDDTSGSTGDIEAATAAADNDRGDSDADVAAYCQASLALETVPDPEIDYETASDEEIAAAMTTYVSDLVRPAVADIVDTAPEELADEVEVLTTTVDEIVETGNVSLLDSPEVVEASESAHAYDLANCGWAPVEVVATNYAFDGIPAQLDAGITSFDLTNEGNEVHELLLVRRNDGVTQSAEELLALPEEDAMSLTTMVGEPAFAPPGTDAHLVADLEPGDYVALCFIPTGMTSDDGPPPEGPPHAMHGMVTEFTVA